MPQAVSFLTTAIRLLCRGDTGVLETLADHAPESELIAPDQQRLALRVIGADVATATAVSSQRGDMQYESGVIC